MKYRRYYSGTNFLIEHKNIFITCASLCIIAISSVLIIMTFKNPKPENESIAEKEPIIEEIKEEPAKIIEKETVKGIKGSDVKKELESLKKNKSYAIIVASKDFIEKHETTEAEYLISVLNVDSSEKTVDVEKKDKNGNLIIEKYIISGINYGNVLAKNVIRSIDGEDNYLVTSGFLMEDETITYYDTNTNKDITIAAREAFNRYTDEEGVKIDDNEEFTMGRLYDLEEKEIGRIYYPILD